MPAAMPPPPSASSSPNETMAAAARRSSSWGPYASAGDFKSNALVIISILFCAVLLFLAFNSVIRFLLCASCPSPPSAGRGRPPGDGEEEVEGRGKEEKKAKAVAFSKDTRLAGAAAECAICLSEFSEGDGIRVLPACNHGFHVRCVEKWLALRRSCPTCRGSALLSDTTTTNAAPGSVAEDV